MTCIDPNPTLLTVCFISIGLLFFMAFINMRQHIQLKILSDRTIHIEEETQKFINENNPRIHYDNGYREGLAMRETLNRYKKGGEQ